MSGNIIKVSGNEYTEFLRDESRSTGSAESISFPSNEEEIRQVLSAIYRKGLKLTVQGARTGLTGAAVPRGGHVMNLSRMNRIMGARYDSASNRAFLTVQPGIVLSRLRKELEHMNFDTQGWSEDSLRHLILLKKAGPWFFTPDPTETSASIGGMVACNASGARSFLYGPTRDYIEALRVVLPDGSLLELRRGIQKADGRNFSLRQAGPAPVIGGTLPSYQIPAVKNASGYYVKEDMDLIDLFIGSEGTLGLISEIEIRLVPAPRSIWGITVFFPREDAALRFVRAVRGETTGAVKTPFPYRPAAIEYFNSKALELLRKQKEQNPAFAQIQELKTAYNTAIYVEYHGNSDEELHNIALSLGDLITAGGGDENNTWVARKPADMEKLLYFRHAIPESVNLLIDQRRRKEPGLTKLGTDMAVPDTELENIISLYNSKLQEKGLDSVMFGHIGNNHIHVNILPHNMAEYLEGKALYLEWAREAVRMGGTVSAEHGIGKLKTAFLEEMYGQAGIRQMASLKKIFDPKGILNPGNIFTADYLAESR